MVMQAVRLPAASKPISTSLMIAVLLLAALVAAPLIWLLLGSFLGGVPAGEVVGGVSGVVGPDSQQVWQHLRDYLLAEALTNTAGLLVGTGLGVLGIGIPLAWLTARYRFPGQRFFSWCLALPLAIPAYVMANVYLNLLDWSGPVANWLRQYISADAQLPPIRSLGGCVIVLTLALYPYVYLIARSCFVRQAPRLQEAAQILGCSPLRAFFTVVLPVSLRWWMAGLFLVLMEVLADFGTTSAFNLTTLTTLVFKVWVSLFQLTVACQIALLLLLVAGVLAWLRLWIESTRPSLSISVRQAPSGLRKGSGWLACLACSIVLFLAFLLPLSQLLLWSSRHLTQLSPTRLIGWIQNSLLLGSGTALMVLCAALLLAWAGRYFRGRFIHALITTASMGYAIPGLVLATAFAVVTNAVVLRLGDWWPSALQLLQGSLLILLLGLLVRFLAVAHQPLQAALQGISAHQEEGARILGHGLPHIWKRLHLPLLSSTFLAAGLMVLVDVIKEIPLTLTLRPFGWDTLAVQVFQYSSEGMWEEAAAPGLIIVLLGLVAVWLMLRRDHAISSVSPHSRVAP